MTQPAQAEYIALQTITYNGVAAYHPGDPVHAAALTRLGVSEDTGEVALADSNEAAALNAALASVTGDSDVPALDQLAAARETEGAPLPGSAGTFDPARHTVADVNAYLDEQGDAEKARVIAAEHAGQDRNGIVNGPHKAAAAKADAQPAPSAPRGDVAEV